MSNPNLINAILEISSQLKEVVAVGIIMAGCCIGIFVVLLIHFLSAQKRK